ncbi:MAG: ATP-dependent Clp protease adaptor ClpS [Oxalobacteraceae bacterium]|nr:MAG: ATP-dependent Clp protease adaptor ClpS [Oxalobacteraceae bacterium]
MSTDTATQTKTELKMPSMWKVLMINDDYTPMDFVISILMQVFHKSEEEANDLTMTIHVKGRANVGLFTKEIALTKVFQCDRIASAAGHPLKTEAEEA